MWTELSLRRVGAGTVVRGEMSIFKGGRTWIWNGIYCLREVKSRSLKEAYHRLRTRTEIKCDILVINVFLLN